MILKNFSTRRLLNFSWIGPLIFFTVIVLAGMVYPDYSHIKQHVSELGSRHAPTKFFMNWIGIIPFGVCISLFAVGGLRISARDRLSYLGFLLLLLAGFSFIVVGLYPVDGTYIAGEMTRSTRMHALAAVAAFLGIVGSQFLMGLKTFTKDRKAFYVICLIMGFIGIWIMYGKNAVDTGVENRGFLQRLYFLNACIWLVLAGRFAKKRLKNS